MRGRRWQSGFATVILQGVVLVSGGCRCCVGVHDNTLGERVRSLLPADAGQLRMLLPSLRLHAEGAAS